MTNMQMKVEENKYALLFGLMKKNVIMVRNSFAKKPKQIKNLLRNKRSHCKIYSIPPEQRGIVFTILIFDN